MSDYAAAKVVDFSEIPVIDVSGLQNPDQRSTIAAQLVETAETIGFFYISGHGVPEEVRAQAFAASERFFSLPAEDKAKIAVNTDQRGWMAQGQSTLEGSKTHDAKEVFFWGWEVAPDDPDLTLPMVATNQWPDTFAPWLRDSIQPYYSAVVDLGRSVLHALAEGLGGQTAVLSKAYEKPLARGQLVYYPPVSSQDQSAERFSAAAHSDFGVLTILAQDERGGLQVQNLSGDWIAAPPIAGTFVCNIGDLLEHWTGRRLVSTRHRVLNTSGHSRYSIPIFCDPASDTQIDPSTFLPGATTKEPITAGDYIAGKNRRNFTQYKTP